jgi:predicted PurR-regulated permease PerM
MRINRGKLILSVAVTFIFIVTATFTIKYRQEIKETAKPLFIALILYYVISPGVKFLTLRKVNKKLAVLLSFVTFIILSILAAVFLLPLLTGDLKGIAKALPDMAASVQEIFQKLTEGINRSEIGFLKESFNRMIRQKAPEFEAKIITLTGKIADGMINIFNSIVNFVFGFIIAFYILADTEVFIQKLDSIIPRKYRPFIYKTLKDIHTVLKSFFQGQLMVALLLVLVEILGLLVLGIPYPLLLGLIGGMSNLIPVIGPFIGAIPSVGIALILSPAKALWTALFFIVIQQIESGFITPRMMKSKVGVHEVTTILCVLLGGRIAGILGMFLAVPTVAIIKAVVLNIVDQISQTRKKITETNTESQSRN